MPDAEVLRAAIARTPILVRTNMLDPDVLDAFVDQDEGRFIRLRDEWYASLKNACREVTDRGCWIWNGRRYPQSTGGARMHRLVATMKYGDLGRQTVHHVCGDARCINPDHLQLVTRAENTAEMLSRRDYERFIERCLSHIVEYNPRDPILFEAMPGAVRRPEGIKTKP